jgi:hypothetical protein
MQVEFWKQTFDISSDEEFESFIEHVQEVYTQLGRKVDVKDPSAISSLFVQYELRKLSHEVLMRTLVHEL